MHKIYTTIISFLAATLLCFNASAQLTIELPAIPDTLRTPESRAAFLATNFFNSIEGLDTAEKLRAVEENFSTLMTLYPILDSTLVTDAFSAMLDKGKELKEVYDGIFNIAETYLSGPESPVYNPEAYLSLLKAAFADGFTDNARMQRIKALLETLMNNRPGTPAADLEIKVRNNPATQLSALFGETPVILIFHDPDCEDCAALIKQASAMAEINEAIAAGKFRIVAIDASGDMERWTADAEHIPANWIDAISPDAQVIADETYYLPRFPAIYVVNADGNVELRDVDLATALSIF